MATPSDFLRALYESYCEGPVFVCSLPNERGEGPPERPIATREWPRIDEHLRRWDKPGRAFYFCVNPLAPGQAARSKATIGEIVAVKADIDAKHLLAGVDRTAVIAALRSTEFLPTAIVASGHGIHAYWFLTEAADATDPAIVELVETMDRQLADIFAGDPKVCEIARLMRMPGSHNTKDGDWIEVEVLECSPTRRYELSDLEDWLSWQSRLLERAPDQDAPAKASSNPFLAVAERMGFKPPLDVEARLSAMRYQGAGDASIHATQLAVSASLLSRGTPIEEVVSILLEATRAAPGVIVDRWNWRAEERALRRMCDTWLAKNPVNVERLRRQEKRQEPPRQEEEASEQEEATVHDFGAARARKRRERTAPGAEQPEHVVLGQGVIETLREQGDDLLLTRDGLHLYRAGEWSRLDEEGVLRLRVLMERGARDLNMKSKARLFSECQGWIERNPDLWIDHVGWNRSGKVIFLNGAVDPATGSLAPHSPEHYSTYSLQVTWTGQTATPLMDRFLEDALAAYEAEERAKIITLIWEWLGSALVRGKGRELSKAFLALGDKRSGKSTVGHIVTHLYGRKTSATSIRRAAERFGLEEVVKAEAWVVHEASQEGKRIDTDDIKAFLSGDDVSMEGKGRALRTVRKEMPVFWASNNMPAFVESTGAMVDRVLPVRFPHIFDENKPVGVALDHLAWRGRGNDGYLHDFLFSVEGSAIAGRALAAWQTLRRRGVFDIPASVMAERKEMAQTSNSVAQFVEECVEPRPGSMVRYADIRAAAAAFVREVDGADAARGMRGRTFWMLFQGACPSSAQWRSHGFDYRIGVALNERGLRLFMEEKSRSDGVHGLSENKEEVNRLRADSGKSAPPNYASNTKGPLF